MSPWVFVGAYGVGYIVSARRFAVRIIDEEGDDNNSRLTALLVALAWPFIALYCLLFWRLPETAIQRQRKIAELEKENERLRRQQEQPDPAESDPAKKLSPWRPADDTWARLLEHRLKWAKLEDDREARRTAILRFYGED